MTIDFRPSSGIDKAEKIDIRIRSYIQNNKAAWNALASKETAEELRDELRNQCSKEFNGEDLDDSINRMAAEIIELRKDPGTYLVTSEGTPLLKLTPEMFYTPPPSTGSDGSIRSPAPILHPRITSGITLAVHERGKLKTIEEKFPNSDALLHIKNPWTIIEKAFRVINEKYGPYVADNESYCDEIAYFMIGKENINGVFQSFNPNFIRSNVYGTTLAMKILDLNAVRYLVTRCERVTNSKHAWYEIDVMYSKAKALG